MLPGPEPLPALAPAPEPARLSVISGGRCALRMAVASEASGKWHLSGWAKRYMRFGSSGISAPRARASAIFTQTPAVPNRTAMRTMRAASYLTLSFDSASHQACSSHSASAFVSSTTWRLTSFLLFARAASRFAWRSSSSLCLRSSTAFSPRPDCTAISDAVVQSSAFCFAWSAAARFVASMCAACAELPRKPVTTGAMT
mmetsp:Transcript_9172/g.24003  ORF Transcript_9172/g.24003 Transcript_9172/m.24003 type:complete len:200 (-) Transcript_9172:546-1145(-)